MDAGGERVGRLSKTGEWCSVAEQTRECLRALKPSNCWGRGRDFITVLTN